MRDLVHALLDLLLPPCCAACGDPAEEVLCVRCARRLPRIPAHHCSLCQQRPRAATSRCAGCERRRRPLDACLAGCWFEGEAAAWIRAFKYPAPGRGLVAPVRARARALALETLARALEVEAPDREPAWVVPVPLHARRLRARGFNPAALLARDLARPARLPVRPAALVRVRDTRSQTGLRRRERRRNVRRAFRARAAVPERVWLVDDVVTTGATLEEAARALRRAGARRVVALCAARTPAPGSPA